ncbi:GtrA family protein [Aurantimonas sp. HBX-1]|uniref:GtrA family protein n=1 Tax=Aurantimonas sp. HBX-1 TaxID=2906072 RepID=UPI001F17E40E|nr:GtrA family protein [Aurantimonas sp. HBX-1]UIJ71062.1 GtrA family protein [Aurantimonas sp. HBX-1]
MSIGRRNGLLQFARYVGVGGATALVYFGLIFLTVELLQLGHLLAVSISYIAAITFHFLANKALTFRSREANVLREVTRYICVALVNYVITLIVVHLVVDSAGQSTYLGAAMAIAATLGLGFGMTKFWVFQHSRGSL